nr:MAG TPA: hypothetical protein [Caudoviricetes sp.]
MFTEIHRRFFHITLCLLPFAALVFQRFLENKKAPIFRGGSLIKNFRI